MNSNNRNALAVNDGMVFETERPLWVGLSMVRDNVNGRNMSMSVSLDRDWLWVRFAMKPSEAYIKELMSNGFTYAGRRKAWHAELNGLVVKLIKKYGAESLDYQKLASYLPAKPPVENLTKGIDLDAPVKDAIKNKQQASVKNVKRTKQASEPVQPAQSNDVLAGVMVKLMEELVMLRREVNELRTQSTPENKPLSTVSYSNGYHVGGIKLG
jgi:hypothetical protein